MELDEFDQDLQDFGRNQLIDEIIKLREAIRFCRDSVGDDECFLDFRRLFELLPESISWRSQLPCKEIFLDNCRKFWESRKDKTFTKVDQLYENWQEDKPY